jgi:alcohol dehydrogenase class IV
VAGRYELHHGLCISLLLPQGLAYNLPVLGDKRPSLLEAMGMPASLTDQQVVERVKAWLADLGLPLSLEQLGIDEPDLEAMAEEASRMVLLPNNPRPATAADCQRLLEGVL